MEKWRLINTETNDGFQNMAIDEAIMKFHQEKKVPPTVRFYSWEPAALSLGYFQKLEKEVNQKACQKAGINIVRRLTGGRAILHDKELTYSIIIREDYGLLSNSIVTSYQEISQGLVAGLNLLKIPAKLKPIERGKKSPKGNSAACFDAPSWYEVLLENKKLIGSAQTRKNGTILQHGSIPYEIDSEKTFKLFNYSDEKKRKKARRIFSAKSTSLKSAGYNIDKEKLKAALIKGLSESLGFNYIDENLTSKEINLAKKLKKEKYSTDKWNKKR
ncbi:MAG: lipoate--protein ligase family protein [Bacillota bacterium]